MKLWVKNTILAVVLVLIIAVPLLFMGGSEFGGSDGEAESAISEIDSSYEPWFESPWEPPSGEIESLFFCVQAAIGAGIAGFVLGRVTSKKNKENTEQ
ncbi:MAG: energy-coupling factor ABC transporter substrate-binding protein [Oscillospiraceae bacterium]|nr:energy-coupling factor ABC transporter substrate-binding protein [Oscillospiraceae bacterium]